MSQISKPIRSQTIRTVVFPLRMAILLCDRFFSGKSPGMTSASSCHSSSPGRRNSRGSPASDRFETGNDPCVLDGGWRYSQAPQWNASASGSAYVLWRARGYLISRILLTFQVNEDKTTTCQVLLIWHEKVTYKEYREHIVECSQSAALAAAP
ncbi:hypothetical protein EV401DRAFT_2046130 [Pisolithus croceorrhizus]|nr:hypothetical protein EV401DRAFT_2046130 [Pisolithus croceorrhizus]